MGKRKEVGTDGPALDPTQEPEGMSTAERTIWRLGRVKTVMVEVRRDPKRPLTANGKKKAERTVAMGIVAEQLGISPMGLRQSFIRHARATAAEEDGLERYPIDTLGVVPDAQAMADVVELIGLVDVAAGHLGAALSTIRQIHARHLPLAHDLLEPMYGDIKALKTRLVARLNPVSACPYCKGLEGHANSCGECSSTGIANREQHDAAPFELRDDLNVTVHTHGVSKPVAANLLKKRTQKEEPDLDDLWA